MSIFKKKVEFEDERIPMSNGLKFIIAVVLIAGLFIGAYKFVDWVEKYDVGHNNIEYVEDM